MAYQICFDLYESASQQFLSSVIQNLRTVGAPIPSVPGSTNTGTVPSVAKDRQETHEQQVLFLQNNADLMLPSNIQHSVIVLTANMGFLINGNEGKKI